VRLLDAVIDQMKVTEKLEMALEPFFDGFIISTMANSLADGIVAALSDEMGDEHETIAWWLYDAPDAGKGPGPHVEVSGKEFTLRNPGELYDFLAMKTGCSDENIPGIAKKLEHCTSALRAIYIWASGRVLRMGRSWCQGT